MFKCPKCGERTVTYARKRTNGDYVFGRYRRCPTCGHKFSTIERLDYADREVKRQGYLQAMDDIKTAIEKMKDGNNRTD